jgi:hypothetical protein
LTRGTICGGPELSVSEFGAYMFQIEIVESADPVLRLLRSSPHEIFDQPFAGYALFLFGESDEGVATWFARSLVSLDSLTGEHIACVVFAKRIRFRGTVTMHESPRPGRWGAQQDRTGAYSLRTIHRGYVYRPLAKDATAHWRPSDEELAAVTYEVDHIASELSVVGSLPCIVFFDAMLSAHPTLSDLKGRQVAVLPLRDNPGNEVIRFLRRALQKFRYCDEFEKYVSTLRDLVDHETRLRDHKWRYIEPKEKEIERLTAAYHATLDRLAGFRIALPAAVSGASLKWLRRALSNTPEITTTSVAVLEAQFSTSKNELSALAKTIGTLEYYALQENWPLSTGSKARLSMVSEKYVKYWLPDLEPEVVVNSRSVCEDALSSLKGRQRNLVDGILAAGPDLDAIVERTTNAFNASIVTMKSELAEGESRLAEIIVSLEKCRNYCTSANRPSLVATVLQELELSRDASSDERVPIAHSLTVFLLPNATVGDTYVVGQAGAVGPGARAENMTFNADSTAAMRNANKRIDKGKQE